MKPKCYFISPERAEELKQAFIEAKDTGIIPVQSVDEDRFIRLITVFSHLWPADPSQKTSVPLV